jgi:hypothetical protein
VLQTEMWIFLKFNRFLNEKDNANVTVGSLGLNTRNTREVLQFYVEKSARAV